MNIKTVSVTYGRKWNVGNYESATVELSIWADVDEDDDPDYVTAALWAMAKASVKEQSMPLIREREAEVEQVFMGLPIKNGGGK